MLPIATEGLAREVRGLRRQLDVEAHVFICPKDMRIGTEPCSAISKSVHDGGTVGNFTRQHWRTLLVSPLAKVNRDVEPISVHSMPAFGATRMKASIAGREPMGLVQPMPMFTCVGFSNVHHIQRQVRRRFTQ